LQTQLRTPLKPRRTGINQSAENSETTMFRVMSVMTTSIPLHTTNQLYHRGELKSRPAQKVYQITKRARPEAPDGRMELSFA